MFIMLTVLFPKDIHLVQLFELVVLFIFLHPIIIQSDWAVMGSVGSRAHGTAPILIQSFSYQNIITTSEGSGLGL